MILGAVPGDPRVTVQHRGGGIDEYHANLSIVDRDSQTGAITGIRPVGYVYSPGQYVPDATFSVVLGVQSSTGEITTFYPARPTTGSVGHPLP